MIKIVKCDIQKALDGVNPCNEECVRCIAKKILNEYAKRGWIPIKSDIPEDQRKAYSKMQFTESSRAVVKMTQDEALVTIKDTSGKNIVKFMFVCYHCACRSCKDRTERTRKMESLTFEIQEGLWDIEGLWEIKGLLVVESEG